jgi:hypothetical protein
MGAKARHVLQVKRKNSTNWSSPEAKVTVDGSVATRLGPRGVTTGRLATDPLSSVEATAPVVGVDVLPSGIFGLDAIGVETPGAQEASTTTNRIEKVACRIRVREKVVIKLMVDLICIIYNINYNNCPVIFFSLADSYLQGENRWHGVPTSRQ